MVIKFLKMIEWNKNVYEHTEFVKKSDFESTNEKLDLLKLDQKGKTLFYFMFERKLEGTYIYMLNT